MAGQVSQVTLGVLHDGDTKGTVSQITVGVLHDGEVVPVKVSQLAIGVLHDGPFVPVKISQVAVSVLHSVTKSYQPGFLVDGEGAFFTPTIELSPANVEDVSGELPEINPHRPDIPVEVEDVSPTLYEFLREQTEIIRQQHNITQAGDSTFHWKVLRDYDLEPRYTLGSIGRFYHPDYGMILARYVQFKRIVSSVWLGAPVGRLRNQLSLDWAVTNDFTFSGSMLVMGLMGGKRIPVDNEYGWIIVQGVALYGLYGVDTANNDTDTEFSWKDTNKISPIAGGRVIGRLWVPNTTNLIPVGKFWVDLGDKTGVEIRSRLDSYFASILSDIVTLDSRVDALDLASNTDELAADILSIEAALASLTQQLNIESTRRGNEDTELWLALASTLTETETLAAIQSAVSALQATLELAIATLENRMTLAESAIISLLARTSALESAVTDLQTQMSGVNSQLTEIYQAIYDSRGLQPLVNGDLPGPTLLANESGECVMTEM